jgi:hypothetical protein
MSSHHHSRLRRPLPRTGLARSTRAVRVALIAAGTALAFTRMGPVDARQQSAASACRVSGRAVSGNLPLPGVSVLVRADDAVKAATSTDPDGSYHLALPAGIYALTAELTGFVRVDKPLTIGPAPCDQTVDFALTLAPRGPIASPSPAPAAPGAAASTSTGRGAAPA